MKSSFSTFKAMMAFHLCVVTLATTCNYDEFFVWQGIHSDGVSIETISEIVHVSSCERICRLYTKCMGFNINWTDREQKMGLCTTVMASKLGWIEPNRTRPELAFYEKNYSGKNVALPSEHANCTASIEPPDHECTNVMDGRLASRWASSINDESQWISVDLATEFEVDRIDIYHSCKRSTQCNTMKLVFSSGETETITRQCNGHLTERTCYTIDVPVEVYYLNKIRTDSVKIFCIERCPETGWVGYREVLIWAETPVSRR